MKLFVVCLIQLLHSIQYSAQQYYQQPSYQNYYQPDTMYYSYKNYYQYNGNEMDYNGYDSSSEECKCDCADCYKPKPCCTQACMSCNQANVVLVPYPYPLIMQTPSTTTEATTANTTASNATTPTNASTNQTTSSSTTAITPTKDTLRKGVLKLHSLISPDDNKNYILASVRRTKSNTPTQYGMVQIPDTLAHKLMWQLRRMKEINS